MQGYNCKKKDKFTTKEFINFTLHSIGISLFVAIYYIFEFMIINTIYTAKSIELIFTPYKYVIVSVAYIISAIVIYMGSLISELKERTYSIIKLFYIFRRKIARI